MTTPFSGLLQGAQAASGLMGMYNAPKDRQLAILQQQAKLDQSRGLDPVSQQNIAASKAGVARGQRQDSRLDEEVRLKQADIMMTMAKGAIPYLESGDEEAANTYFSAVESLINKKIPDEMKTIEAIKGLTESSKVKTAEIETFDQMTEGLTQEEKALAKRMKLGLEGRAVGSAAQTIAETGQTDDVATSEAAIAGAKAGATETETLKAQLNLKPEVEKAVKEAVSMATANSEIASKERSNSAALKVYEVAMRGLSDSLGGAYTGPLMGLIPSMTANQQIAQGAVAAMGPVLKQIFRTAGEGTFTDQDQKLLFDMMPTRSDHPEARAAKINLINSIVMAKLGAQGKDSNPEMNSHSAFNAGEVYTDAAGNKAKYNSDGTWTEVD